MSFRQQKTDPVKVTDRSQFLSDEPPAPLGRTVVTIQSLFLSGGIN